MIKLNNVTITFYFFSSKPANIYDGALFDLHLATSNRILNRILPTEGSIFITIIQIIKYAYSVKFWNLGAL